MNSVAARCAIALTAIGAGLGLWFATPYGLGVSTDSVAYLVSADTFVQEGRLLAPGGAGELVPLSRFPPLYPLLLAGAAYIIGDVMGAARVLAALLLALNVALMGRLAMKESSPVAGAGTAVFAFASLPVVEAHTWAWSESIFLAGFLGLACATDALLSTGDRRWLLAACFCAAVTALSRFAGVGLVIGAGLCVVFWSVGSRWRRLLYGGTLAGVGVLPLMWWLASRPFEVGPRAGRSLAFHPPGTSAAREALSTIRGWLLPIPPVHAGAWIIPVILLMAAVTAFIVILAFRNDGVGVDQPHRVTGGKATPGRPGSHVTRVLFLLGCIYCAFTLVAFSFFDADIPFDDRILLPLYCLLLIIVMRAVVHVGTTTSRLPLVLLTGFVVTMLALHGYRTWGFLHTIQAEGLGYTRSEWRQSQTVSWVRDESWKGPLFSNFPDVLTYQTGLLVGWIPWKGDPNRAVVFDDDAYACELERFRTKVIADDARIVFFRAQRRLMPDSTELAELRGIVAVKSLDDGIIFGPAGSEPSRRERVLGREFLVVDPPSEKMRLISRICGGT